jgi:hypothetical protein
MQWAMKGHIISPKKIPESQQEKNTTKGFVINGQNRLNPFS